MATISEKVKQALASLEVVRKELNAVDEAQAELGAVRGVLEATKAELAHTKSQLAKLKEDHADADAEHARWLQTNAREEAQGNARVDQLQARLRVLDEQCKERQAEHDSIVAGISALGARLNLAKSA